MFVKCSLLSIFLVFSALSYPAQSTSKQAIKVNLNKPSVWLEYLCSENDKIQLRLNNNTIWHLKIFSAGYWGTKKPVLLLNGNRTFAAPDDVPIESLFYHVEIDKGARVSGIKLPKETRSGIGNDGGGTWIAPADSVFFPVPVDYLHEGLKVAVSFKYEWEIPKDGHLIDDPEHTVFFTGRSLSKTKLVRCSSKL